MWGSGVRKDVLTTFDRLSSESCQERLKEMVFGTFSGEAADWLLEECQPCPECFVLSRRETGCDHIVCRCGCDFCFGCGAPNSGHQEAGCICCHLEYRSRDGQVFFAAWLRSAYATPCEWLCEEETMMSLIVLLHRWVFGYGLPVHRFHPR